MNRLTFKINDFYLSQAPCTDDMSLKLGVLEDIEEHFECPLDIVFQALKKGIRYYNGRYYETFTKKLYEHLMLDWEHKAFIVLTEPVIYSGDHWNECGIIYLKDHGTKWWIIDEIKQCPLLLSKENVLKEVRKYE